LSVFNVLIVLILPRESMNFYGSIARVCTSFIDVPDRIAIAVYFAGCSIRCKGCQNQLLWNRDVGVMRSVADIVEKIKQHPLAESVVFLGGEPTDQHDYLLAVARGVTMHKVLYTGREFEQLSHELQGAIDMVICGPYRPELHVDGFPASKNQRIFNKLEGTWICQS
jgi:anaerobic ribonucleoside-triphosphate reductase activating protein